MQLVTAGIKVNQGYKLGFRSEWGFFTTANDKAVMATGLFLCVLQAADGFLTSLGISRFGLQMEGNPILRYLMGEFGHVAALTLVKILAIAVVLVLMAFARRLPWVRSAMDAVSFVYMFLAIMPWMYLLFIKPYVA